MPSVKIAVTLMLGLAMPARAANVPPAPIAISGSAGVAQGILLPSLAKIEQCAGVKMAITMNSSGSGLGDLLANRADIAMISAPLSDLAPNIAGNAAAGAFDLRKLRVFPLPAADVTFIVNSSVKTPALTAGQVTGILSGQITNWREVGGPDMKLALFVERRASGVRAMIEQQALAGNSVTPLATEVAEPRDVLRMVARMPGAIGFVSATTPAALRRGTRVVHTDLHARQFFALVTNGPPPGRVARTIAAIRYYRHGDQQAAGGTGFCAPATSATRS